MKLVWKGKYKDESQLEKANLPEDAVKFREPDSPAKLNLISSIFIIPVIIFVVIMIYLKRMIGILDGFPEFINIIGLLLAYLMIIPHELIHAAMFPEKAEVSVWYSLKNIMAFVHSTYPMSKKRFIWMSLLPSIVFGLIPLIIWLFIPESYGNSDIILSFAFFSLLLGVGDYLNVFNALRQMPKGAITQLSGFNSYWYMPDNKQN
ncbi:MAG: DUF3267 domain-containing protein [Halanaerobiales bacterium]